MAKIQSIMLLGLREQAVDSQDLDIVNTAWTQDTVRVTWKRSLKPPFDGDSLRIRYASAALNVQDDSLVVPYDPIDGFKYHGAGTGVSQVVTFREANNTVPSVSADGKLLSEWIAPEILLVGGSNIGWSILENSIFTGYETVTVPLGTTLRFTYFILIPIVTVSTVSDESAFQACSFVDENANQVGGLYDSPVDVAMDQPGNYFFASDFINPATGRNTCESGAKIKVIVLGDPNAPVQTPTTPPADTFADAPTTSQACQHASMVATLICAMAATSCMILL